VSKAAKLTAMLVTLWLAVAAGAAGEDWTQFRGPGRQNATAETGWLRDWPEEGPPLAWTAEVGSGNGTVAVTTDPALPGGGLAYIQGCLRVADPESAPVGDLRGQEAGELKGKKASNREMLSCVEVSTGKVRWQYELHPQVVISYNSPHATPSIHGARVYGHGQLGVLACVHAAGGEEIWRRNLVEDHGTSVKKYGAAGSPLVTEEIVYVIEGAKAQKAVGVYAFDKDTGSAAWQAVYDIGGQNPHGSPLLATVDGRATILCHLGEAAVGLDPQSGAELWKLDYMEEFPECKGGRVYSSESYPMVMPDGLIVDRIWNDVPAAGQENRSAGSFGRTVGFRVRDGKAEVVWQNTDVSAYFLGNQIWDGHLYCFNNRTTSKAYTWARNRLTCLDLKDGQVRWMSEDWPLPGVKEAAKKWERNHEPTILVADGVMIINDGLELVVARCSPEGCEHLGGFTVRLTAYSSPVLADGRLFVRGGRDLHCYDLRAGAGP